MGLYKKDEELCVIRIGEEINKDLADMQNFLNRFIQDTVEPVIGCVNNSLSSADKGVLNSLSRKRKQNSISRAFKKITNDVNAYSEMMNAYVLQLLGYCDRIDANIRVFNGCKQMNVVSQKKFLRDAQNFLSTWHSKTKQAFGAILDNLNERTSGFKDFLFLDEAVEAYKALHSFSLKFSEVNKFTKSLNSLIKMISTML